MNVARVAGMLGGLWLVLVAPAQTARAYTSYVNYVPNGPVARCLTCHVRSTGGGTRNPFGEDVKRNRVGITPNWAVISTLDSDTDGFSNGEELGDPCGCWRRGLKPAFTTADAGGPVGEITRPGEATSVPSVHTDDCSMPCPDAGVLPDAGEPEPDDAGVAAPDGGARPFWCLGGENVQARPASWGWLLLAVAAVVTTRRAFTRR